MGPTLWHKIGMKVGSTVMIILPLHREGAEGVWINIQAMVNLQIPHNDVLKINSNTNTMHVLKCKSNISNPSYTSTIYGNTYNCTAVFALIK